jgi:hypothetical protein
MDENQQKKLIARVISFRFFFEWLVSFRWARENAIEAH